MSKVKYFTPKEVSLHVTDDDLWVSLFGKVLDLSPISELNEIPTTETSHEQPLHEEETFPLLAFAGKDISHFFDASGEVKLHVDPNKNEINTFLPFKVFPDVPSQKEAERSYLERKKRDETIAELLMQKYNSQRLDLKYDSSTSIFLDEEKPLEKSPVPLPWWKDEQYVIGRLTKKPRWIKIMNTMIMKEVALEVCSEETLEDISERYSKFNSHVHSYTWKYFGEALNMKQTLEENGIPDIDEELDHLKLNSDDFVPTIMLYFNHDLTEM